MSVAITTRARRSAVSKPGRRAARAAVVAGLLLVSAGCDDPIQAGAGAPGAAVATPTPGPATTPPPGPGGAPAPAGGAAGGDPAAAAAVEPQERVYADEEFVELDVQQRDPFRHFAIEVIAPPAVESIMSDTSVDEMRVLGIVTGGMGARAMIADRSGVGYTVRVRNYIGRPETVQVGGSDGIAIPLVWRIDRIRPNEVVLTRENPSAPDQPPLTRTLTLRNEDQMLLMSLGDVAPIQGETATPVIPTIPSGG